MFLDILLRHPAKYCWTFFKAKVSTFSILESIFTLRALSYLISFDFSVSISAVRWNRSFFSLYHHRFYHRGRISIEPTTATNKYIDSPDGSMCKISKWQHCTHTEDIKHRNELGIKKNWMKISARQPMLCDMRQSNGSFCKSYWHAAQNFSIHCNLFNAIEMDFGISRIVFASVINNLFEDISV